MRYAHRVRLPARMSRSERDRDPVASLHDTEWASGDEETLEDLFFIDRLEAQELGVALDLVEDESFID